jgi:AbrB family looped-hinge helix DNA binding protein
MANCSALRCERAQEFDFDQCRLGRDKASLSPYHVDSNIRGMSVTEFRVSDRGQMALPAEARRRWNLNDGGSVEVADLGDALLIVPAGRGGLRTMLREAIQEAGGYSKLAGEVAAEDPELA